MNILTANIFEFKATKYIILVLLVLFGIYAIYYYNSPQSKCEREVGEKLKLLPIMSSNKLQQRSVEVIRNSEIEKCLKSTK